MERSVFLVDHDQLFAGAMSMLLAEQGYAVTGSFAGLAAAKAALDGGESPDMVILDPAGMEGGDASAALTALKSAMPSGSALVVLSSDVGADAVTGSLQAGADGHLEKTTSFAALLRALLLIELGQAVYPRHTVALLSEGVEAGDAAGLGEGADLSPRELQILSCLLGGLSNKAIARRLNITESTVKMHFKNVLRKIRAANRTQAAVWALENGIAPAA